MGCSAGRSRLLAGGIALATLLVAIVGCGSTPKGVVASASEPDCATTVARVLSRVARRIYHEGVASERTVVARHEIAASKPLQAAVEAGDAAAASAAASALIAAGHMTDLRIVAREHTLADVGKPALAPFGGVIENAARHPIATYLTSVWSDEGFLAETDGVTEGRVALRRGARRLGGSFALPAGRVRDSGQLTIGHTTYAYSSFPATAYPKGRLRVYVLRSVPSTRPLCGASSEQTTVATLSRVATLIYAGEAGARTRPQVRRVQRDAALLQAVAQHNRAATQAAVRQLLNEHIVRLRVLSPSNQLLADVGGPYVLAPVSAPLRLHGRTVGHFVLSIQDDEGYLRLSKRLAGLSVLMYMNIDGKSTLVKNSLGPEPPQTPTSGRYEYRGRTFQVFTLDAAAFPAGTLTIRVLIPIPYS